MTSRNAAITPFQKTMLKEFLKMNPQLGKKTFTQKFTHKTAQALWEEIGEKLNAVPGGASKDWRRWRKTWQDLKKVAKHKMVEKRRSMARTVSGPQIDEDITDLTSDITDIKPEIEIYFEEMKDSRNDAAPSQVEIKRQRLAPVINEQKKRLTQFIHEHENLRYGKFTREFTKLKAQQLWKEISVTLNAIPGGSRKNWAQWRKTWQDMKKNRKAKALAKKRYTGGAPSEMNEYASTETIVLDIIPPIATFGDPSVPVPNVDFQFDPNISEIIIKQEEEEEPAPLITEENEITEIPTQTEVSSSSCYYELPSMDVNLDDLPNEYVESPDPNQMRSRTPTPEPQLKKSLKAQRLEKSMVISDNLVKIEDEKKNAAIQYYKEKTDYLKWRRTYEQEKLEILRNQSTLHLEIVQELRTINSSLGFIQ